MEGEDSGKTKGKHEGVISFSQIYSEGVTDYTAQRRGTLHIDGSLVSRWRSMKDSSPTVHSNVLLRLKLVIVL